MIIGISGKIGSGKDTAAEVIQGLDTSFQNKKFAAKLKQVAGILLGVDPAKFEDREYKNQQLGTEWSDWFDVARNESADPEEMAHYFTAIGPDTSRFMKIEAPTVRSFLQRLGTEAIRQRIHQNAWVNALFAEYTPEQNWVITDVRFENEAQRVKDMGGSLIRIDRPTESKTDEHPSETALDGYNGWDYYIANIGDLDEFNFKVKTVYESIIGEQIKK